MFLAKIKSVNHRWWAKMDNVKCVQNQHIMCHIKVFSHISIKPIDCALYEYTLSIYIHWYNAVLLNKCRSWSEQNDNLPTTSTSAQAYMCSWGPLPFPCVPSGSIPHWLAAKYRVLLSHIIISTQKNTMDQFFNDICMALFHSIKTLIQTSILHVKSCACINYFSMVWKTVQQSLIFVRI